MKCQGLSLYSLFLLCSVACAMDVEQERFLSVGFDSSHHRTPRWEGNASAAFFSEDLWRVELGGRFYFDHGSAHDYPHRDPRAFASFQWTAMRSREPDFFLNLICETDAPSEMTGRGLDITPSIKAEFKVSEDLWIGADSGVALATAPDEGSRAGYFFASVWSTLDTEWLGNESDSISLTLYGATHEVPGFGNTIRLELSYSFDIIDNLCLTLGGGAELKSPYPHSAMFFAGKIEWKF